MTVPSSTDSLRFAFIVISSVRELSDGRVLVSDERAGQLLVADFLSDTAHVIGRQGQGPGEYRQVGRLRPTRGDTTLHKEPYVPRVLVLAGSDIVATLGSGEHGVGQLGFTPILGVDSLGRAAIAAWHRDSEGRLNASDSLHVLRVQWRSGAVDTSTRVQSDRGWSEKAGIGSASAPVEAGGGRGAGPKRYAISLVAPDQVAVMPSGWIAVARAAPYRVDWCAPTRGCAAGPALQTGRRRLTDEDKRHYLRRTAATSSWPPTERLEETSGWPDFMPPVALPPSRIDASAIIAAPGDRVLVQRTADVGAVNARYDVIDRVAGIVGWMELLPSEQVVGFGAKHMYLSRTTEDGWQQLRRHPWPF